MKVADLLLSCSLFTAPDTLLRLYFYLRGFILCYKMLYLVYVKLKHTRFSWHDIVDHFPSVWLSPLFAKTARYTTHGFCLLRIMACNGNGKRPLDMTLPTHPTYGASKAATSVQQQQQPEKEKQAFPIPKSKWVYSTPQGKRTFSLATPVYKDGQIVNTHPGESTQPSSDSSSLSPVPLPFLNDAANERDLKMREYVRNLLLSDASSSNLS